MQEEHRVGGRYEVDVAMDLNFDDAALSDDLNKTVDYEGAYSIIRKVVTQNKFYLIERLAYLIATEIVEGSDLLESVEVTVRKANPPVGGPCDCAEAVYRARRLPI
ncbi:MAG: dihydroneopterin aldolase [Rhodothermales bacterium]|jgi:dihydroneopterin aldolase